MADRPIIFSASMVRALLAGRKAQTRRILKLQPIQCETSEGLAPVGLLHVKGEAVPRVTIGRVITLQEVRYAVGDRLWVRETCRAEELDTGLDGVRYAADEAFVAIQNTRAAADAWLDLRSYRQQVARRVRIGLPVPSIHMPRWASRLMLAVTEVRVERLQDIKGVDTIAEGVECDTCAAMRRSACQSLGCFESRYLFRDFWNSIHGADAWAANPWVAAISFTVHRANIDALSMERAA